MNLINGLEGEVVDVARASEQELTEIAANLRSRLQGEEGPLWSDEHTWLSQELDIIEEELSLRRQEGS